MPHLFDPLAFLSGDLRVQVDLDPDGKPLLTFDRQHSPALVRQAKAVARRFEKLLATQIANNRSSVRKLLAQGKIELKGGRYVLPDLSK